MPKIIPDERIFQAVISSIALKGYYGSTTKEMADLAGISEVTLFRKFGSKKSLVKQAILYVVKNSGLMDTAEYSGDISADFLKMVSAYQDAVRKYGDFVSTMIMEASRDKELRELLEGPLLVFRSFSKVISRYQKEGMLRGEPPMHTVAALISPIIFTTLFNRVVDKQVDPIDLEVHVQNFIAGRRVGSW